MEKRLSSFNVKCVFVSQTGNVHFSYDPSGGRGGNSGRSEGNQYNVVRRPDVLVQHHVLDSGETIVIPGNLASTPLSSHHNIDDGQVKNETPNKHQRDFFFLVPFWSRLRSTFCVCFPCSIVKRVSEMPKYVLGGLRGKKKERKMNSLLEKGGGGVSMK